MNENIDIVFAIMAVQEAVFFAPVAKRLIKEEGLKIAFLTFHEAGDDVLEKEGIPCFSLHKIKREQDRHGEYTVKDVEQVEKGLGTGISHLIFHEMHLSGRSKEILTLKAVDYYFMINNILRENNIRCIVQELGGFIAPLTLYYTAKKNGVNHVFIEPAMFRKRIVFTLNDLYADIPHYGERCLAVSDELRVMLNEYLTRKTVVIPKKDRHFFQDMTFRRLLSSDNFKRLSRKLYHKYVLGREEEYNWILRYINMHVVKTVRRKILSSCYSNPVDGEKYFYYPFHVPLDVQLTARCPDFFEQENLIGQIAASIPSGYKLYVKEHPAAIGGHSLSKLKGALAANKNIRLIHPGHNSFDIIKNAACIITVNSKVGFESIIQGRPVIVLGKTFYRGKGVTFDVADLGRLGDVIDKALKRPIEDVNARESFLAQAYNWSFKGELYENSPGNVQDFYSSLLEFMVQCGTIKKQPAVSISK